MGPEFYSLRAFGALVLRPRFHQIGDWALQACLHAEQLAAGFEDVCIWSANEVLNTPFINTYFSWVSSINANMRKWHNVCNAIDLSQLAGGFTWHHDWVIEVGEKKPLVLSTDGWNDARWMRPPVPLIDSTMINLGTQCKGIDCYLEQPWKDARASGNYNYIIRVLTAFGKYAQ